jgi:hypothetical protein
LNKEDDELNESQSQIFINQPTATFVAYDEDDIQLYAHATGYYLALLEIREHIHNILKYETNMQDETVKILEDIEQFILSQYQEHHLPLE